jgi:hypothetical protein
MQAEFNLSPLFTIFAPDKEAALDEAVKEFRIDPARRFRPLAEPME